MPLLFVYGTLKRDGPNHAHLARQKLIGAARTAQGFTLYSLGDYPGMVRAPDDHDGVTGEVWAVDEACLQRLDHLEGVAENLYRRGPVPLRDPFEASTVQTYFYLRPIAARPHVGATWRGDANT